MDDLVMSPAVDTQVRTVEQRHHEAAGWGLLPDRLFLLSPRSAGDELIAVFPSRCMSTLDGATGGPQHATGDLDDDLAARAAQPERLNGILADGSFAAVGLLWEWC